MRICTCVTNGTTYIYICVVYDAYRYICMYIYKYTYMPMYNYWLPLLLPMCQATIKGMNGPLATNEDSCSVCEWCWF